MSNRKLPERCPICNTKKKNILLHIKSKESCFEKMDKQIFEEWQKVARKETKRKYQIKFNLSGGHNKARDKRTKEAQKLKALKERKFFQKLLVKQKAKSFIRLAGESLLYLSQGRIPRPCVIKNFHFFEEDPTIIKDGLYETKCLLNEDQLHAWLKEINSQLFETVISFQTVVLITESNWLLAIKSVEETLEKKELKDKLFRLIGKLKAYENENTKKVTIPEEYKSICMESTRWKHNYRCWNDNIFTKEDEKQIITLIEDILGRELCLFDMEVKELLKVTEEMENLYVALAYTKYEK